MGFSRQATVLLCSRCAYKLLSREVFQQLAMSRSNHYKVIIAGAGVAGLTAGKTLMQAGVENICILEASSRIGGRVKTVQHEGGIVNLGAEWIHGDVGNPLYTILHKLKLIDFRNEYLHDDDKGIYKYYDVDGHEIEKGSIQWALEQVNIINTRMESGLHESSMSLSDVKKECFKNIRLAQNPSDSEMKLLEAMYRWCDLSTACSDGPVAFDHSPSKVNDPFNDCGGKNFCFLQGTETLITEVLLDTLEEKIQTDSAVTKVDWNSSVTDYVTLTTSESEFTADHVVVTPSVCYMQANHEKLFTPALPEQKVRALSILDMGIIEKLWLHFAKPFWNENEPVSFNFIHTSVNQELEHKISQISGNQGLTWWKDIFCAHSSQTNPNVLCVWLFDDAARQMHTQAEDAVLQICLTVIEHFTQININKQQTLIKSRWGLEEYILGSWSTIAKDYEPWVSSEMLKPLCCDRGIPRLLFAGEAYHHEFMSTMHGAYETGRIQAQKILEYIEKLP